MIYHLLPDYDHIIIEIINYFILFSKDINTLSSDHSFIIYSSSSVMGSLSQIKDRYVNLRCKDRQVQFIGESKAELRTIFRSLTPSDCMIIHGRFHPYLWDVLIWYPSLWKKTAWIIWGGDLYVEDRYYHSKSFVKKIKHMARRRLVQNLGMISVMVPDDMETFRKHYISCRNWVNAIYPTLSLSSKSFVHINNYDPKDPQKDTLHILVGNSAAPSNNHEKTLSMLEKFRDEDIHIICPLGYPDNPDYKETICRIGRNLYGQKFNPILVKLGKPEYVHILDSIDILVFNHDRQQGLFNLNYILFQGKKAYVNGQCSTYKSYSNYGIKLYDTAGVKDLSFDEFVAMPRDCRTENIQRVQKHWSIEASFENWRKLISTITMSKES